MNRSSLLFQLALTLCLCGVCADWVLAQRKKADSKAGKAKKGDDEEIDLAPKPIVKDDPVILQLRESDPKTLADLTRALRLTSQLNRPDEFQSYAKTWLELKPTDSELAALNRKYGTAFFFELARRDELRPEGEQIGTLVIEGAGRYARDPARLNEWINQLSAEKTKTAALRHLKEAGDAGITALIGVLADDTFMADRAAIRDALVDMGRDAVAPLTAVLSAPSSAARADAAIALSRLSARSAVPYLIGLAAADAEAPDRTAAREALGRFTAHVPDEAEASDFLESRIGSLLGGEIVGKLDEQDQIALWRWDDEAHTVVLERHPKNLASLVAADRFARQLFGLAAQPQQARLALIVRLEVDQTLAGLDQPLPQGKGTAWESAEQLGLDQSEAALVDAIKLDRPTAISALCEILGASGRPDLLDAHGGHESPLVVALGYPDRRVQVAALKAILALDPMETFPGASRVIDTMKFLLSSSGKPRVLVGHPQSAESSRIGTLYGELGYETEGAATGRALLRLAKENADIELILISETIDAPSLSETVQALRKDPRTARVPVGILEHFLVREPKYILEEIKDAREIRAGEDKAATLEQFAERLLADERHAPQRMPGGRAERTASADSLAVVVPSPHSPQALMYVHDQVMGLAPTRRVDPEIRLEQTYFILEQLAEVLAREHRPAFYDFAQLEASIIASSRVPVLSTQAARVLGLLATPKSQLALSEQSSLTSSSKETRAAALQGLTEAIRRRGILLTSAQIQQQYDRLNKSTEEEKILVQQLIDVLEAPSAEVREQKKKLLNVKSQ
jgi:hypothetical protein